VTGKMVRRVIALALLAVACSNNKSFINEDDPFDDPFFNDGLGSGTRSLDEILREPSPSVGWLARDGATPPRSSRSGGGGIESGPDEEGVLLEAEGEATYDPEGRGDDDDEASASPNEKSFYDQASEATLATMSILVGAGMAALPFLIGT
jgi:hypothetical protein